MSKPMEPAAVAAKAEHQYSRGEDATLLETATRYWAGADRSVPATAEIARYSCIAAFRSGDASVDLWRTRSIAAAAVSGNTGSLALILTQHFYAFIDRGRPDLADAALEEMERLADRHDVTPPASELVRGILAERRALLETVRERWDDAAAAYQRAAGYCQPGSRRAHKVRGGMIRAEWLAGGPHAVAADAFDNLVRAAAAFPDVIDAATTNLSAARDEDRTASVPFDLI